MKANQTFRQDDEAVSPVIGVILMVAITVVLAAVVFVLVTNLSKDPGDTAPSIAFTQDKSAGTVTVQRGPTDTVPWDDIEATGTCVTGGALDVEDSELGVVTTTTAWDGGTDGDPAGNVTAGDKLVGCATGETLTLKHVPSDTLIAGASWTF